MGSGEGQLPGEFGHSPLMILDGTHRRKIRTFKQMTQHFMPELNHQRLMMGEETDASWSKFSQPVVAPS